MVSYCPICGKPVYFGEKKRSLGRDYHPLCLKCHKCSRQLNAGQHAEYDDKPYCSYCYLKMFGPKGNHRCHGVPTIYEIYVDKMMLTYKRTISQNRTSLMDQDVLPPVLKRGTVTTQAI